jgi:hypothetical protein
MYLYLAWVKVKILANVYKMPQNFGEIFKKKERGSPWASRTEDYRLRRREAEI